MVGKPMQKILCQGRSRQTGKPCGCKGYRTATGLYLCKYHGGQNRFAFNNHNYSDKTRILKLKGLKQFKNYTDEQIKEYYYTKTKPRITDNKPSRYYLRKTSRGTDFSRDFRGQKISVQLDEVLRILKKEPKDRRESN